MIGLRCIPLVLAVSLAACQQAGPASVGETGNPLAPSSVAARPESAHAIRVLSGELTVTPLVGDINLKGTGGFQMISRVSPPGGRLGLFQYCFGTLLCVPGYEVDLAATWSGSDLPGTVTLRGTTYEPLGGGGPLSPQALIAFTGTVVLPPFSAGETVEVTAPFTFTGRVGYYPDGPGSGRVESLIGHGIVRVTFERDASGTAWLFEHAVYEFQPSNR